MTRALGLVLALAIAPLVLAQSASCLDNETIEDCLGRLMNVADISVVGTATMQRLAVANTGVPSLSTPAAPSMVDFLSLFTASANAPSLTEGDNGSLVLDWNLGAQQFTSGRPFKLQSVFYRPVLNAKVKAGLNATLVQQAEQNLDDLDDIEVSVAYSPHRRHLGRALTPHHDLLALLTGTARVAEPRPDATQEMLAVIQQVQNLPPFSGGADVSSVTFAQLSPDQRAMIEPKVLAAAREQLSMTTAYENALTAVGVEKFRKLLHLQPQAYASVRGRTRKEVIGPNEVGFKLTYETSGHTLNSFYKRARATCDTAKLKTAAGNVRGAEARACLDAWHGFLADSRTQATLKSPGRFTFSIQYTSQDANEVSFPTATPPFNLKTGQGEMLSASITYGRSLTGGVAGPREGRIDLTARYDNVTGDPTKDNRYLIAVVYAQKVSDTLTMPLGFVYANHPKDVADADRRVTAQFGVIYKLPSAQEFLGGK